jgi:aspartate/tyrosine/aromatic aminotransferase
MHSVKKVDPLLQSNEKTKTYTTLPGNASYMGTFRNWFWMKSIEKGIACVQTVRDAGAELSVATDIIKQYH